MFFNVEKPGKPQELQIKSVDKDKVSLTWQPPEDDGGAEIFNYVIEYRVEGAFKWLRANDENVPETAYTVKKLKKKTKYEFHVAAENKAGVGPFCDPTAPVEAKEHIGNFPNLYLNLKLWK